MNDLFCPVETVLVIILDHWVKLFINIILEKSQHDYFESTVWDNKGADIYNVQEALP